MANMEYCRFRNTLIDFRDCLHSMEILISGDGQPGEELSRDELQAAAQLLEEAVNFIHLFADELDIDTGDACDLVDEHTDTHRHVMHLMSSQATTEEPT